MSNINIRQANRSDTAVIHRLAHEIWWPTYQAYIPHGQIKLMLALIYNEESLRAQMQAGQRFSIVSRNGDAVGFVGFQPKKSSEAGIMRIEKIYIQSFEQGKGTGRLVIDHVSQIARTENLHFLELNVNRNNPAKTFYEKQGFHVIGEVDTLYHDYVLNDYIMQKQL